MILYKKPYLLSFAGNPMRYHLTPDTLPDPTDSIIEITFTDIDTTEDHSIEIDFMGVTRTFTLKGSPASDSHLPAASVGMTPTQWATLIHDWIINDGQIFANYKIDLAGAVITLTALTAGDEFDWTVGASTITGVTVATTTGGQTGSSGTVEGVRMQVWENGTVLIGEDYKPVDSSGSVKFEIQEYIWMAMFLVNDPRFLLKKPGFFHNVYYDSILKYRTVFTNKVAGVFESRNYSDPDHLYCYAIAGGLSREDLVANNAEQIDYFADADTKKKFLTWSPPSRITDKIETHSLFFAFQAPAFTKYTLMAEITTVDESLAPVAITPEHTITPWTVVEFLCGYAQLKLEDHTNDAIVSWRVYLVDENDNRISDIREFVLDQKYRENTRYFRFRNSWGGYDSLRCTGVFEDIVENDREKVILGTDEVETAYNAPGKYTLVSELQSFKANTGWLSREYLNFLRDFMLSTDIYEVDDDRLLKCLLTTKKTSLFKNREYNYSLAFEYDRAFSNFFFQTPE